ALSVHVAVSDRRYGHRRACTRAHAQASRLLVAAALIWVSDPFRTTSSESFNYLRPRRTKGVSKPQRAHSVEVPGARSRREAETGQESASVDGEELKMDSNFIGGAP